MSLSIYSKKICSIRHLEFKKKKTKIKANNDTKSSKYKI